jgi:hypothetical protein
MLCSLAKLEQEKLAVIQALEQKTGSTVLAFSCSNLEAAVLDQAQLNQLQSLEKDLGLSLVAVKA